MQRTGPSESEHRDGQAARRAQPLHELLLLDDQHAAPRGERNQLLADQRAATALERVAPRVDLVGAVDAEVEAGRLVERGEREAEPAAQVGGALRSGYAAHAKSAAGQRLQRRGGCAPGSVAEQHPVLDQRGRRRARRPPLRIRAQRRTMRSRSRVTPVRPWISMAKSGLWGYVIERSRPRAP